VELTLNESLKKGIEAHKTGQVQEAHRLYTSILKAQPKHPDANHNMGVLSVGVGKIQEALHFLKTALDANPGIGQFWLSYIDALIKLGRITDAKAVFSQAKEKGAKSEAFDQLEKRLSKPSANPQDPPVDQLQSIINLYTQGRLQQALSDANQMLERFPNSVVLYNIAGASSAGLMQFDAAIDSFKQALKINPKNAEVYNNIGNALNAKGDPEAAIGSYKRALEIKPDYAEAYSNMGGVTLEGKDGQEAAIESCKQALKIKPDYAEAYNNMGIALNAKGELEAAIDCYKQAVLIKPDYADAYYNKGNALVENGALVASIKSYEMALKIKPDYQAARANKLDQQAHICDWAAVEQDRDFIAILGTSTEPIPPFVFQSLEDAPERHRVRSETYTKKLYSSNTPLPLADRPSQKPQHLRIGYFSADFHEHPVAYLMAKVLETHDRGRFEVYGYSIGPAKNDDMRQRLIKAFDVFTDVSDMNGKEVALLARHHKIDIAIDLTGYTKNSRPGIFACRAAPIQINYLGYSGTMGADFIDYIIADPVVIPNGYEQYYSERILRLPNTFLPTDNSRLMSTRQMTRSEVGLPEAGFVICCFNNNYKISPREFDIWMRVLVKVEGSVLWLRNSNAWSEDNLRRHAEIRGVDPSRLVFAGWAPMEEHLTRQKLADIFLDTFAYNAHTTASEALWAELPVVTKAGKGFSARAAASLLTAVGLPELITETEQEYEALILNLATNPERLAQIRKTLADKRLSAPLFDTALFTKHLEDGYQQVYQRYYDGKLPDDIFVPEHCL
jgi:protein O-GlcNAc transferase